MQVNDTKRLRTFQFQYLCFLSLSLIFGSRAGGGNLLDRQGCLERIHCNTYTTRQSTLARTNMSCYRCIYRVIIVDDCCVCSLSYRCSISRKQTILCDSLSLYQKLQKIVTYRSFTVIKNIRQ
uniref:Putative secreted protein n=1 Tax=Anopheles marajoara TaxID=58244 RepID=A0A2M4C7R5_9DIPT